MDRGNERLLSSPPRRDGYRCKVLMVTLVSVATLLSVATFLLYPSTVNLRTNSPDAASCHAIVSAAVLASSPNAHRSQPAQVLRAILARSLDQHDAAAAVVSGMHRRTGDPRQRAALSDCVQLMELARDRLSDAADTAPVARNDARTWLSAVLTDHVTCLDGLDDEPLRDAVGAQLEPLKSLASASLAVLNAVDSGGSTAAGDDARDVLAEAADNFPSWVPTRDRTLLEGARCSGGRGGGQGREWQVQDGEGGGGRGPGRRQEPVRDLRQERGVQGERRGGEEEARADDRRRRHGRDGHHRQPQRGRWLHHFQFGHSSGGRGRDHPTGPEDREHGGAREAPGGGPARERRPRRRQPLPPRRVPGHPLRAPAPAVLPRLRRLRHGGLRLRERGGGAAALRAHRAPAHAGPEERGHRAGPDGPEPEHGHVHPAVPRRAGGRPGAGRAGVPDVPGPPVEGLLAGGVHAVVPGRARPPEGLAGVGRRLRARDALPTGSTATRGPGPAPLGGSGGPGTASSRTGAWPRSSPSGSSSRAPTGSTPPAWPTTKGSDPRLLPAPSSFGR